jgi:hypothetical protein
MIYFYKLFSLLLVLPSIFHATSSFSLSVSLSQTPTPPTHTPDPRLFIAALFSSLLGLTFPVTLTISLDQHM